DRPPVGRRGGLRLFLPRREHRVPGPHPLGRGDGGLRPQPAGRRPGSGRCRRGGALESGARLPAADGPRGARKRGPGAGRLVPGGGPVVDRGEPVSVLAHVRGAAGAGGAPAARQAGRRRRLVPYLLLLPGGLWLIVFFAAPAVQLVATSLYDPNGSVATGYAMTWSFGNYPDALRAYAVHFGRSFLYAGVATILAVLLGYPLAYAIAQKAGRWKHLLLVCVVAPMFTSFLVRTLAWKTILSDNGWLVGVLRDLHLLGGDGRLLFTPVAVILGLTYNFLPFMVLPLYASLERLDRRLLEAAGDLYASPLSAFRKV